MLCGSLARVSINYRSGRSIYSSTSEPYIQFELGKVSSWVPSICSLGKVKYELLELSGSDHLAPECRAIRTSNSPRTLVRQLFRIEIQVFSVRTLDMLAYDSVAVVDGDDRRASDYGIMETRGDWWWESFRAEVGWICRWSTGVIIQMILRQLTEMPVEMSAADQHAHTRHGPTYCLIWINLCIFK